MLFRKQVLYLVLLMPVAQCVAQDKPQPCNPQPPCLPVMEQGFGFQFAWSGQASPDGRVPGILVEAEPDNPQNNWISTRKSDVAEVYLTEFINPERLHWTSDTTFLTYFYTGRAAPDTLLFRVGAERINCCPQWTIREVCRNGATVCAPCDTRRPVRLDK